MLLSPVAKRPRVLRWTHLVWGRALTVFVLTFVTPAAAQIVREVVSLAVGSDCCGEQCDDEDGEGEQRCPGTCAHCAFCAHPNVLPAPAQLEPIEQSVGELAFSWPCDSPYASGYRTPPFRPPAA